MAPGQGPNTQGCENTCSESIQTWLCRCPSPTSECTNLGGMTLHSDPRITPIIQWGNSTPS